MVTEKWPQKHQKALNETGADVQIAASELKSHLLKLTHFFNW